MRQNTVLVKYSIHRYRLQCLHVDPHMFVVGRARSKMANLAEMLPGRAFPAKAFADDSLSGVCAPPGLLPNPA